MTTIATIYHSGHGHTKAVAEHIHTGVQAVTGATSHLVSVADLPAPDPQAGYADAWKVLDKADALIMGCPTYMGSVSAGFKVFMESSSGKWAKQVWRDKLAAGFTLGGGLSGDKLNALTDLAVFSGQHSMIWVSQGLHDAGEGINRMGSYLGYMAQTSNAPPDQTPPPEDRKTAELFGERVARAAVRWAGAGL